MGTSTPSRHNDAVARLTNLAFALHGAARTGGSPDRSSGWIRTHVDGYGGRSDEALSKQLSRDVVTLQRAGVPVVQSSSDEGTLYRLNAEEYQLPEVQFTPEEAMVLGIAGGIGQPGGLSDFTRSAWTKIAASGASRDLAQSPAYLAVNDTTRMSPQMTTAILTAVRAGLRITFEYRATPSAEPVKRRMDPWGLVNHGGRVYLVGWDVDREAVRVFRTTRIANVKRSRQAATHLEVPGSLQEIVEHTLHRGETTDALLKIPEGSALELCAAGQRRPDGLVQLKGVHRDWLVRTAAGYAPDVIVLEPPSVRADIVALLSSGTTTPAGTANETCGKDS